MTIEPAFRAEVTRRDGMLTLALAGELDLETVDEVEAVLPTPASSDVLLVDLRELRFMDSSGIHVLMRLDGASRREGWSLVLLRAQPAVQRVLDLCHIGDRIRTVDSPSQVASALR